MTGTEDLAVLQDEVNRLRELRRESAVRLGPLPPVARRVRARRAVAARVRSWRERLALRVAPWVGE